MCENILWDKYNNMVKKNIFVMKWCLLGELTSCSKVDKFLEQGMAACARITNLFKHSITVHMLNSPQAESII